VRNPASDVRANAAFRSTAFLAPVPLVSRTSTPDTRPSAAALNVEVDKIRRLSTPAPPMTS
jgi:hypothetical protein